MSVNKMLFHLNSLFDVVNIIVDDIKINNNVTHATFNEYDFCV